MEIPVIPTLEHLCCMKIVLPHLEEMLPFIEVACLRTSRLFEDEDFGLSMDPDFMYKMMYSKISKRIQILTSCTPLQNKLLSFIGPLFCEIEDWLKFCKSRWGCHDVLLSILVNTPNCWSPVGSFNREKSATILVKDDNFSPTFRFIFACTFCLLEDVLDIWKILTNFAKAYLLRHADVIVTLWIEWLESCSKKDSQCFLRWALETKVYCKNVYIMKFIFRTLNALDKSQYLTNALAKREVNSDVMRFGFPLVSRDVQRLIFQKSPVEVFKCITSWPLRSSFSDIIDFLMPYLTCDAFCDILNMLLLQIKLQKKDYEEFIVILKKFWSKSPFHFKDLAKSNTSISEPLQIALDYDFTSDFPTQTFLDSFDDNIWSLTPFVI